jgi:hypothetical protein
VQLNSKLIGPVRILIDACRKFALPVRIKSHDLCVPATFTRHNLQIVNTDEYFLQTWLIPVRMKWIVGSLRPSDTETNEGSFTHRH